MNILGQTPFEAALSLNQMDEVRTHILNGADVNHVEHNGYTPMHRAAWHGSVEILELLFQKGANPDATTSISGVTPLILAVSNKQVKAAGFLISNGAIHDHVLHQVAKLGLDTLVTPLIESGVNINEFNEKRETALHVAARYKQIQMIRALMQNGADATLLTNDGRSAAQIAARNGIEEHDLFC